MNILLLNPPGDRLYARDKYCTSVSKARYYWPQIDLLMLSGILGQSHRVEALDAIVEGLDADAARARIERARYDAIVFLTSSASWKSDFSFMEAIKKSTGCLTIANGGFLLFRGAEVMRSHGWMDAVLLDFTADDILRYLDGNGEIKTMIYRRDGAIVKSDRSTAREFSIPVPRHELFPLKKYLFPLQRYPVFTVVNASFGCPFKCNFCISATLPYKLRDVDNVLEELRYVRGLGIREVLFHDSTFTARRDYSTRLCDSMIREKLGLHWICQTRVDCVDEELLGIMKRSGCHSIEFGVESGADSVRKEMSKGVSTGQIERAFSLCRKEGIRTDGFFIIGMPGDTEESINNTIDLAIRLKCDFAAFSLPMPHPGTKLGEAVKINGWVLSERDLFDDVSSPTATYTGLTGKRVWELRNFAYRRFYMRPGYILRRIVGLRTWHELRVHLIVAYSIFKKIFFGQYAR
jgi:radical SAM superfamily enzyme YgiQ (UPF0313 family)